MSLSILGMGGRTPTWQRQHRPQPPPGGGPPGNAAAGHVQEDEVSTSLAAGEQARTEIAAINQAIQATEQGLALVSTARHGLEAVQQRLARMAGSIRRILADRPSGAGPPPAEGWQDVLRTLQDEARAIDDLARETRFGDRRLLDGSCGCRGAAFGPWLEFVAAGGRVRSSPPEGYPVVLKQEPTRAAVLGERSLTADAIAAGETLALETEGTWIEIRTRPGQSLAEVVRALNQPLLERGLPLAVLAAAGDRLLVHHRYYGSGWRFRVRSGTPGILSGRDGEAREADNGRDVVGTLNGEPAEGKHQLLVGSPENRTTAGLAVRYTGTPPPGFEPADSRPCTNGAAPLRDGWKDGVLEAGRVLVVQRSLKLRLGGTEFVLRFDAATCAELGRGSAEADGIACVADAVQAAPHRADRALAVIELARAQVAQALREAVQAERETLPGHLAKLRVESENRLATEGAAGPPADVTAWVAQLGIRLRVEGAEALHAQRYPRPTALLRLLGDAEEIDPDFG